MFNMREQSDTESVDAYIAGLRKLIKSYSYCHVCDFNSQRPDCFGYKE